MQHELLAWAVWTWIAVLAVSSLALVTVIAAQTCRRAVHRLFHLRKASRTAETNPSLVTRTAGVH
jgi:hypothetical protein